jgi:hypothetical protein
VKKIKIKLKLKILNNKIIKYKLKLEGTNKISVTSK